MTVHWFRRAAIPAGPLLALALYALLPTAFPAEGGAVVPFSHTGRATLSVLAWMALWWMTEAVEIEVTSLLPLVVFPLAGIAGIDAAAAPYASSVVFLFLGGFILAIALQRCGLDRRMAFLVLRSVGTTPDRLVGGMLVTTAFVSMWVSNTAAAAMMVPIAVAVVGLAPGAAAGADGGGRSQDAKAFATALLLSIAYGASIGGLATLIGSPPNGIAARFLAQRYAVEVSFLDWLAFGLPLTIVILPIVWLILTRIVFRCRLGPVAGGREYLEAQWQALGPMSRAERTVAGVFLVTVALWVTRPWLASLDWDGTKPLAGLSDAGIAMLGAVMLFVVPVQADGKAVMDWAGARRLPWGVLLLFGGGLSLAGATEATDAAAFIGSFTHGLSGLPVFAVVLTVVAATTFASELTSNTAQVALMLPLLAALAPTLGVPPSLLILPCTLAASLAFMMPVGTPPNAIVFGSGLVTIPQMMRAGLWLNLAGIAVVTAFALWVIGPLYGGAAR